ncbi:MAG: hypothetical protein PWQ82_588 [Thermosediminibacterales bacterium]|nr:hypothetical protein [Thermosediminibacterales bacterium]MDK2835514.1 hypothetical protein [Thermosediminibacterales bacterium]
MNNENEVRIENSGYSLLDAVIGYLNCQRDQNIDSNTLISLLTLCNLLGIVNFLNTQTDSNFFAGGLQKTKSNDKQALINKLMTLLSGSGDDSKLNPQTILSLMKVLNKAQSESNDTEKNIRDRNQKRDEKSS